MTDPFKDTKPYFSALAGDPEVFFPWIPRRCFDGTWVWLKPAWRRLCIAGNVCGAQAGEPWWQYARKAK